MLFLALVVGSSIAGAPACASHAEPMEGERFPAPAFKGVELYSWTTRDGTFRYALHWGTNRAKAEQEIKADSCVLADVAAVKKTLSRLADGEWVTWLGRPREEGTLAYPSRDVIESLVDHSKAIGITLNVPSEAGLDR